MQWHTCLGPAESMPCLHSLHLGVKVWASTSMLLARLLKRESSVQVDIGHLAETARHFGVMSFARSLHPSAQDDALHVA